MRSVCGLVRIALSLGLVLSCRGGCSKSVQTLPFALPSGEIALTALQMEGMQVQVAPVIVRTVSSSLHAVGQVTFDDTRIRHVFSPLGGRVTRIVARLGERVKQGDPLVILAAPEIASISAEMRKAEISLVLTKKNVTRKRELAAVRAISEEEADRAEEIAHQAEAEFTRAKQKMELFGTVDHITQTYMLRSPIQGEVLTCAARLGMEVQEQWGEALFSLGEMDPIGVFSDLFESDLAQVQKGAEATVSVAAYPHRVFKGHVDWIASTLDPTTHTVKVRCVFPNQDRALRPGMRAMVTFQVQARAGLLLPVSALLHVYGVSLVLVEDISSQGEKRRFTQRSVTVRPTLHAEWVEVTQGLVEGERVVVSGAILLSNLL